MYLEKVLRFAWVRALWDVQGKSTRSQIKASLINAIHEKLLLLREQNVNVLFVLHSNLKKLSNTLLSLIHLL